MMDFPRRGSLLKILAVFVGLVFLIKHEEVKKSLYLRTNVGSSDAVFGRPQRKLQDKPLVMRVRNADLPSSLKLGECEGHCVTTANCADGLVCFQRTSGEDVPGCSGESRVAPRADFCINPNAGDDEDRDSTPSPPNDPSPSPPASGPSPSPPAPSPSPPSNTSPTNVNLPNPPRSQWVINPKEARPLDLPTLMTSGPDAKIKLYWSPKAWWQEENFDRKWCMRCRQGCRPGNGLMIVHCDQGPGPQKQVPNLWNFVQVNANQYLIKVKTSDNTCLHMRDRWTLLMARCDQNEREQLWTPTTGSFARNQKFQISPVNNPSLCITQRHHPRYGETIGIEPCATAQKSHTAEWNLY